MFYYSTDLVDNNISYIFRDRRLGSGSEVGRRASQCAQALTMLNGPDPGSCTLCDSGRRPDMFTVWTLYNVLAFYIFVLKYYALITINCYFNFCFNGVSFKNFFRSVDTYVGSMSIYSNRETKILTVFFSLQMFCQLQTHYIPMTLHAHDNLHTVYVFHQ